MDDLVRDLQKAIEDLLKPAAERNDRHSALKAEERQAIAYTLSLLKIISRQKLEQTRGAQLR
jgi:hypothetical protein